MRDSSSSTRGRRLPMLFMLLAMVVATAVVAIGVTLGGGGMAVAKKQANAPATTDGATIEATALPVAPGKIGEASAVCPSNKRALGGGVVQSGSAQGILVHASGPLNASGNTAQTQSGDLAKQWYAAVLNFSTGPRDFKVFAICG